jgi:hypothetical protein
LNFVLLKEWDEVQKQERQAKADVEKFVDGNDCHEVYDNGVVSVDQV